MSFSPMFGDLHSTISHILKISEELNSFKDLDSLLDKTLLESRKLCNADSGTIYLIKDKKLHFSYVHNDTLFSADTVNKHIYTDVQLPIDEHSIAGYVALHGKMLALKDVYDIPTDLPFTFNPYFDEQTGYKTLSVLTVPIRTFQNKILGVIQLINARDENNKPAHFTELTQLYIPLFANNAALAIEHGLMTREMIIRMMKMAELRDPTETAAHVLRVGAYCAEIYHKWAQNKGLPVAEIKRVKDMVRIASMLHDVGKVGIPDAILKKKGKLSENEYNIMKYHTVFGARLFETSTSELDAMSAGICLNHHEKWNGGGYPGKIDDIFSSDVRIGPPKSGEDIPLPARITAVADVFDALTSQRSYKDAWSDDRTLGLLKEERGKHFDPDVVDSFFEIFDTIEAIRAKFQDEETDRLSIALEERLAGV